MVSHRGEMIGGVKREAQTEKVDKAKVAEDPRAHELIMIETVDVTLMYSFLIW